MNSITRFYLSHKNRVNRTEFCSISLGLAFSKKYNFSVFCFQFFPTWIDLPIVSDPISIDDVLESPGEFVGSVESGQSLVCLDFVQNRRHLAAAFILQSM